MQDTLKLSDLFAGDEIGMQNLTESQQKYADIQNHTVPEIRALLGNVAQTIVGIRDLCVVNDLTKNETAGMIKDAFPTMSKQDRSKMVIYHENFDAIVKHFNNLNSLSTSVDYMVRTWQKFVKDSLPEIKNQELRQIKQNQRKVISDKAKRTRERKSKSSITSPVNAQDHLLNFGHVITNVLRFAENGQYTNDEIDKTIEGTMQWVEQLENCKIELKAVVNQ